MSITLRIGILVVGTLFIVGLVGLLAWGLSNRSSITGLSGITRVDQPAPDFRLELLGDGDITLSEQRGKVVVINFWTSTCPPCRTEARDLEAASQVYQDKDVLFVGANIQDTPEPAKRFLDEFGVTYPNGLDVGGRISIDYGVVGIPVTFVVDGDGTVARRWVGEIDIDTLKTWIDELLAGAAPEGDTEGVNKDSYYRLDEL
ncbi:MAG: TlpA family protein disulfide reductase [Dehalococcoidia bacterium]|nr:TlpA family protein disulfide reductase [Dehalococcoidia bacterium]